MRAKNWDIDISHMSTAELKRFYGSALKAANDRIKTLTKEQYADMAQAYKYMVKPLEGAAYIKTRPTDKGKNAREITVFTQPKAPGKNATQTERAQYKAMLKQAVAQTQAFLGARTSTVAGIKEMAAERRSRLDDLIRERARQTNPGSKAAAEGSGLSNADKDAILRWMGSADGKAAMADYDSNQVRDAVTEAIVSERQKGGTRSISELYEEFKAKEDTFADWIAESEALLTAMSIF